ncbi:MAG: hypothetical protein LJE69_02770 [Thiohalocapsa sp.]|uniref:hypothetical protein n=1 Tax=Thiohalocapsa sp. TaxID=2497641 RepID=UPI0025F45D65|nr:hypothetical protein [Thiohalocapsa sp.]MCG6940156.1 hypothetical protein [Thiohalocapsa sp.]
MLPLAAFAATLAPTIQADCSDPLVSGSTLNNSLVCASKPGQTGDPNQRWSEIHNGDGASPQTLGEHGRGTTDKNGSYDANVGTWSYSGSSVTYNYTGDGTYTFDLRGAGDEPQFFCSGSSEIAEIKAVTAIPDPAATNPCGW